MSSAETKQQENGMGKKRRWNKMANKSKKGNPKEANEAEDMSSENSETDQEEHFDDKQLRKSNEANDVSSENTSLKRSSEEKRPSKAALKLLKDRSNKSNEEKDTSSKNPEIKQENKGQLDEIDEAENISPKTNTPLPTPRRKKKMFDIQCLGCGNDVESSYIVCQECDDCYICPECFSEQYENEVHKKTHSYSIRTLDFPLLSNDWTAKEEYDLLNNIRIMSDYYDPLPTKTAEECRKHYEQFYVEEYEKNGLPQVLKDKPESCCAQPDPVGVIHSSHPPRYCPSSYKTVHRMCGYSAGRGDFITPYDDELEKEFHSGINFNFDQPSSKLMKNLELALVRGLTYRIDERSEHHDIVRNFGLTNVALNEKHLNEMKTRDPECYNAEMTLQPIMRLNKDLDEFLDLRDLVAREERAIARVKQLQDCIRNGIRTRKAAAVYLRQKEQSRKEEEFRIAHTLALHHEAQNRLRNFGKSPSPPPANPKKSDRRRTIALGERVTIAEKTKPGRRKTELVHGNTAEPPHKKIKTARRKPKRKPSEPATGFHKSRLEFHKLLDDTPQMVQLIGEEKELCKEQRLHPKDYLFYKDRLIRSCERTDGLTLTVARRLLRIDNSKTRYIYDFLLTHGHIKRP